MLDFAKFEQKTLEKIETLVKEFQFCQKCLLVSSSEEEEEENPSMFFPGEVHTVSPCNSIFGFASKGKIEKSIRMSIKSSVVNPNFPSRFQGRNDSVSRNRSKEIKLHLYLP
jgi:hypothetical protein